MSWFLQGIAYYEGKYNEVITIAKGRHASLIDVFDCDDRVYGLEVNAQLKSLNLAGYTRITFPLSDDLDFTKDPSLSSGNILGDAQELSNGKVTGFTSVVEKDGCPSGTWRNR